MRSTLPSTCASIERFCDPSKPPIEVSDTDIGEHDIIEVEVIEKVKW